MLDKDDNYMNCSGAIGTYVWIHAYDIFEEIINKGKY